MERIGIEGRTFVYPSPDGAHTVALTTIGHVRWGPTFHRLEVDDRQFKDLIVGGEVLWSDDSRFVVLQEWLTTDPMAGPTTVLTAFDVVHQRLRPLSRASRGYIRPVRFEGHVVVYTKAYAVENIVNEFEMDLDALGRWEPW